MKKHTDTNTHATATRHAIRVCTANRVYTYTYVNIISVRYFRVKKNIVYQDDAHT